MITARLSRLAVPFAAVSLFSVPALGEMFTISVLPDTQCYSGEINGGTAAMFEAQTAWIAGNAAGSNIKHVVHLGDIVENQHDLVQWNRAKTAMQTLENAGISFGTNVGNHDTHYGPGGGKDHGATNYLNNFGPDAPYGSGGQTFGGQAWNMTSPSGRSNAQIIPAGDYEFLFLNLSIDCPDSELDWGQSILEANRDKPAILSTHRHIYDFKMVAGYYGDAVTGRPIHGHAGLANESYYVLPDDTVLTNWPADLEESFVKDNPNIFMVLCGHCHAQYHTTSFRDNGVPIIEVLTDYQDGPAGGAGWMRNITIDTVTGEIDFDTFSPVLGRPRHISDDFAETLVLVSLYKEVLLAQLYGLDPSTPEGRAAIAEIIRQFQGDLDAMTNPEISELLGYLADIDAMDPAARPFHPLYGVWAPYDEVRTYVTANHPLGPAAWDPTGDWDGMWGMVFADGSRDPSFSMTVDFDDYIPEPGTMTIVAAGLIALFRRRR